MSEEVDRHDVACTPDGGVVVVVDGAEVLAWSADTLEPAWKVFGEHRYAAVTAEADRVWLVDRAGRIEQRRPEDGALLHAFPGLPDGGVAAASAGGTVALASDSIVTWWRGGHRLAQVPVERPTALAVDAEGARVAVADAAGTLMVFDVAAAEALGRVTLGGVAHTITWNADGYWLAATRWRVRPVRSDGQAVERPLEGQGGPVTGICHAVRDTVLVTVVDGQRVDVRALSRSAGAGSVRVGRRIQALTARHGALFLALEHGDLQYVDLLRGTADAARPQDGRARRTWAIDVGLDPAQLRGGLARSMAGEGPLAVYVPPPDPNAPRPWRWYHWLMLALGIVAGLGALWWFLGWMGWI